MLDHGAVGDGTTLDTAAVQAAIDAAHAAGGGRVVLAPGHTFLVGSIELRSGVEFRIERGAVLQGSSDWADYTARFQVGALSAGVVTDRTDSSAALLVAREAKDIAISGGGVIDGASDAFIDSVAGDNVEMPNERPFLVFLLGCRNVTVRDVTLRNSAWWTLRLTGCEDVVINALRIRSDVRVPDSDGIAIDRCRRVRISDCDIECGDDAISLKTCDEWPEYGPCEDVTVTGCTLSTRSSALVVGVDVSGTIRNVIFSSCVVRQSHRGLSVSAGTGGDIENVLFSDIVVHAQLFSPRWWGSGEAIVVRSAPWHDEVGRIQHVRFRNVLAHSESGILIFAAEAGLVDDVVLDGVRVELERWTDWPDRRDLRPYVRGGGPYATATPGVHVERAGRVVLRDSEIAFRGERRNGFGSAVAQAESPGLVIENLVGEAARPSLPRVDEHAALTLG